MTQANQRGEYDLQTPQDFAPRIASPVLRRFHSVLWNTADSREGCGSACRRAKAVRDPASISSRRIQPMLVVSRWVQTVPTVQTFRTVRTVRTPARPFCPRTSSYKFLVARSILVSLFQNPSRSFYSRILVPPLPHPFSLVLSSCLLESPRISSSKSLLGPAVPLPPRTSYVSYSLGVTHLEQQLAQWLPDAQQIRAASPCGPTSDSYGGFLDSLNPAGSAGTYWR